MQSAHSLIVHSRRFGSRISFGKINQCKELTFAKTFNATGVLVSLSIAKYTFPKDPSPIIRDLLYFSRISMFTFNILIKKKNTTQNDVTTME